MKIDSEKLRGKTDEELIEMRDLLKTHLVKANSPAKKGTKGFDISQTKKTIARINTLLKERKK